MLKKFIAIIVLALGADAGSFKAQATTLSAGLTADNGFTAYLSTTDFVLGNPLVTGTDWGTEYYFTTSLVAGSTYYIHIVAANIGGPNNGQSGNPDGYIGRFNLSDTGFQFGTNTQTLGTDLLNWKSDDAQGSSWFAPVGVPVLRCGNGGICGTGWPLYPDMGAAVWIWANPDSTGVAYFSSTITPLTTAATPLPAALPLFVTGLAGLGWLVRRRRKQSA
jgi:hypothetical protein